MADCKLTPELAKVIYKNLKQGATFETAAQSVGICKRTLHNWISEGEKGNSDFALFALTIKEIRADVELELINILWDAAKKNPEIAKWLLAHINRDAWGDKSEQKIEHTGKITFQQLRELLHDDTNGEIRTSHTETISIPDKDNGESTDGILDKQKSTDRNKLPSSS